jgi:hypothetical protein
MHKWILKIYTNISSINQAKLIAKSGKTYCKNNWAELTAKSLNIGACLKYYFAHKNVRFQKCMRTSSKYLRISKYSLTSKYSRHQNICASKIFAP